MHTDQFWIAAGTYCRVTSITNRGRTVCSLLRCQSRLVMRSVAGCTRTALPACRAGVALLVKSIVCGWTRRRGYRIQDARYDFDRIIGQVARVSTPVERSGSDKEYHHSAGV